MVEKPLNVGNTTWLDMVVNQSVVYEHLGKTLVALWRRWLCNKG